MRWYPPRPMLGGPLPCGLYSRLAESPLWAQEPKHDGVRCVAVVRRDRAECWSRLGTPLLVDARVVSDLGTLPGGDYDGELCGDVLWLFDVAQPGTWDERRAFLERLHLPTCLRLVPLLEGADGWRRAVDAGAEGVVLKRRASRYRKQAHHAGSCAAWVKFRTHP